MPIGRLLNYDHQRHQAAGLTRFSPSGATPEALNVRLNLSNSPANIPMVRQALAGFGEAIDLQPPDLGDIRTALTEACNNASIHAYRGAEGPMEVELSAGGGEVGVVVRDRGEGLSSDLRSFEIPDPVDDELPGIGLPAINTLASKVRLSERAGGGTEVAMCFDAPRTAGAQGRPAAAGGALEALPAATLANTIEIDMAPLAVARWVFPRVVRAMAARAHFTVDRLTATQHVGSALLSDGVALGDERVCAAISATPDGVEVALGPLAEAERASLESAVRRIEPLIEAAWGHRFLTAAQTEDKLALRMPRLR